MFPTRATPLRLHGSENPQMRVARNRLRRPVRYVGKRCRRTGLFARGTRASDTGDRKGEPHTRCKRERERDTKETEKDERNTHRRARTHTQTHKDHGKPGIDSFVFTIQKLYQLPGHVCARERERERERKRARERARAKAKAKDTAHTPKTHDVKPNACSHARTTCLTAKAMFAETEEAARKDGGVCIWGGLKWARDDTERRAPSCFTILFAKLSWRADAPRCCSSESACVAQRPSGT